MWIWLMMLVFDIITPALMIIGGRQMSRTKKINRLVGYRTSRSMQNEDMWCFANGYCGKLWIKTGLITLPVTVVLFVPLYFADEKITAVLGCVIMLLQLIVLLCSVYPVEKALKESFNDDGTRK